MLSTINNNFDRFPFPSIPPIVGAPDNKKIAEVHLQLNLDAASVHSNLSNGALVLLYLTVLPAVSNTLSATTIIPILNPGLTPDSPVRSTVAQISALRYAPTTAAALFNKCNRTEKALRQQLLLAVDKIFV